MIPIPQTLIALAVALVVGFGGGWHTKGKFVDAAEVAQVRKDTKESASNVVTAVAASQTITDHVVASNTVIDKIAVEAAARTIHYQPRSQPKASNDLKFNGNSNGSVGQPNDHAATAEHALDQVACPSGDLVLDAGSVRLLNAASQGAALDTTGSGNGEKPPTANNRP